MVSLSKETKSIVQNGTPKEKRGNINNYMELLAVKWHLVTLVSDIFRKGAEAW